MAFNSWAMGYDKMVKEQKKMRNIITIFDGDKPRPKFTDLSVGELFRYPMASDPSNIYMKTDTTLGPAAILLSTGTLYTNFNMEKELERITTIRITR